MFKSSLLFDGFGRLRSGWRAAVFLAIWIFFSGLLGAVTFPLTRSFSLQSAGRLWEFAIGRGISLISALFVGWLCVRWLEGLPLSALGASRTRGWLKHLILGIAIGSGGLSLAVAFAATFGDYRFELNNISLPGSVARSLGATFIVLAIAAAFEEAFFRGYMFQTLSRSGLAWLAMAITAVFFGSAHLQNPSSGLISTINTVIAGLLFGFAYLKTRDLWFTFGIHLLWNWMQGPFFGIEISGLTDLSPNPLLREVDKGPEWLTGGSYGIEGGIAATAALVLTTLFVYFAPIARPDPKLLEFTSPKQATTSES